MAVTLSTESAITILAVIASVFFVLTGALLGCTCWCICSRKSKRCRIKPATTHDKTLREVEIELESNLHVDDSSQTTSMTGASSLCDEGDSAPHDEPVQTSPDIISSHPPILSNPVPAWQEDKQQSPSPLLKRHMVLPPIAQGKEETSISSALSDTPTRPDSGIASSEHSSHDNGDSSHDNGNDSHSNSDNKNRDNVFEPKAESPSKDVTNSDASTTVQVSPEKEKPAADSPSQEYRVLSNSTLKRKRKVGRTNSTEPLLNGSENRPSSQISINAFEESSDTTSNDTGVSSNSSTRHVQHLPSTPELEVAIFEPAQNDHSTTPPPESIARRRPRSSQSSRSHLLSPQGVENSGSASPTLDTLQDDIMNIITKL